MYKSRLTNNRSREKSCFRQRPKKCDPGWYHFLTSGLRCLPDFIIIGAMRSGTTSLFHNLSGHPMVIPSRRKEVHFFDFQYDRGLDWYKGYFPLSWKRPRRNMSTRNFLTGEASPSYLFHPHAPARMLNIIPKAKCILLLRNPVERAFSHYRHAVWNGVETLPFSEVIRKEDSWIGEEYARMCRDENYYNFDCHERSYLARGVYITQLKRWLTYFPKEQIMIIRSEDFFARPHEILQSVWEFLELPSFYGNGFEIHNKGGASEINEEDRMWLRQYFRKHNELLYELIGKDLKWENI